MSISAADNLVSNWLNTAVLKITLNKLRCGLPIQIVVMPFCSVISNMPFAILECLVLITSAPNSVASLKLLIKCRCAASPILSPSSLGVCTYNTIHLLL